MLYTLFFLLTFLPYNLIKTDSPGFFEYFLEYAAQLFLDDNMDAISE